MNKITKVIIIDDDKPSVTVLANELEIYKDIRIMATAMNCTEGEHIILKHKPDLLFLDIELSNITGLEFLSSLQNKIDWDMKVVFYTSYDKYILQALRIQAFDVILKPVNKDELSLVMNRFYTNRCGTLPNITQDSYHYPATKSMLITTITNDKIVLRPQNIGYFKYDSERKLWEIMLDNSQHFTLKHQTTAEVILNYSSEFIQIHKAYIININYLGIIKENTCAMLYPFNTVTELKISKVYKKKLLDKFYNL